jgi:hypothetical protein
MASWQGWAAVLAGSAYLVACAPAAEDERIRILEQRIGALESKPAPTAPSAPQGATLRDVQSLESRLAALEQRVAALGATAAGPAAAGAPTSAAEAETRLEARRARRERLREVTDQYRARLAAIRQEHTDPAARQQAVREALQWYRDERRAVLAGEEPAAADAP